MAKAKMVVFAKAVNGDKAGLDEWYRTTHVPDLLAVPGVKSIERFDISVRMTAPQGAPAWDSMGIYELEADDIAAVLQEIGKRMKSGEIEISPVLDSPNTLAAIVTSMAVQ